jgi:hypothetical protein
VRAFESAAPLTLVIELGSFYFFPFYTLVYLSKLHSVALAVLLTGVAHPNCAVEATPTGKYTSLSHTNWQIHITKPHQLANTHH